VYLHVYCLPLIHTQYTITIYIILIMHGKYKLHAHCVIIQHIIYILLHALHILLHSYHIHIMYNTAYITHIIQHITYILLQILHIYYICITYILRIYYIYVLLHCLFNSLNSPVFPSQIKDNGSYDRHHHHYQ